MARVRVDDEYRGARLRVAGLAVERLPRQVPTLVSGDDFRFRAEHVQVPNECAAQGDGRRNIQIHRDVPLGMRLLTKEEHSVE